jgi:hypothetical protein
MVRGSPRGFVLQSRREAGILTMVVLSSGGNRSRARDGGHFPSDNGVRGGLVRRSSRVEILSNRCGTTSSSSMHGRFGAGRATATQRRQACGARVSASSIQIQALGSPFYRG